MSSEKQEAATEQRKRKAREQGDIPVSRELTSSAAMLVAMVMLAPASAQFVGQWHHGFEEILGSAAGQALGATELMHRCVVPLAPALLAPCLVMIAAVGVAIALGAAQAGGLQVHVGLIGWKLDRISPVSHAKQIFSTDSLVRLAKSVVPAVLVVWLARKSLERQMLTMPFLTGLRLPAAFAAAYQLALTSAWISVGWSGLDYAVQRRRWSQKLRMSKQDIRDEMKEANGNPQSKARLRQVQRAMRRRKARADVRQATVIITNPTHYAVALSFDTETMAAPRVLAKGRDLHAFAIREEARWAGVPIVENPPLARSLYRSVEEGQPIPFELYTAVAAILAYLLRREAPAASPRQQAQVETR